MEGKTGRTFSIHSFGFLIIVIIWFDVANVISGQANYTESEREALQKFHNLVDDVLTQDYQRLDSYLIRWLRAKNFDVIAANDFFRKYAKWRKEKNVDSILNETILEVNPPIFSINGFDYEGRPIISFTPTNLDLRGFLLNGHREKILRDWDHVLEEGELVVTKASVKSDGRIFQGIGIADLKGFNVRQHACVGCLSLFLDWTIHYESHHPELAKYMIFINAPRVFIPIVELCKPLLSTGTRKALKIFPLNKMEWSAYLNKIISPNELPFEFGGTRKN